MENNLQLQGIIDALNQFKQTNNILNNMLGHFIYRKSIDKDPNFPIYKNFKIEIYYHLNGKLIPIISGKSSERISNEKQEELVWHNLYVQILSILYKMIDDKTLIKLIEDGIPTHTSQ
jgi:hypothetical protein